MRTLCMAVITLMASVAFAHPTAPSSITLSSVGGAIPAGQTTVTLVLHNGSNEALRFATYDRGNVHNTYEIEQPDGRWQGVGIGYCGMGLDGTRVVAPNTDTRFEANVPSSSGRLRVRMSIEREVGGVWQTEELVTAPITHR